MRGKKNGGAYLTTSSTFTNMLAIRYLLNVVMVNSSENGSNKVE
jgi:hypothetical protein